MYEILKDVPLPAPRASTVGLPFDQLSEPGDSFLVPFAHVSNGTLKVAAQRYMKMSGRVVSVFKDGDGSRVYLR